MAQWSTTRNEIIRSALRKINGYDQNSSPESYQILRAIEALNTLILEWQNEHEFLQLTEFVPTYFTASSPSPSVGSNVADVKDPKLVMGITDADGVCQSQNPGGAGSLTINGAMASSGAVSLTNTHKVSITAAGDESAFAFTITGTDSAGNALTEEITGPNATTVYGSEAFKTITDVAVDGDCGAVTVGLYPYDDSEEPIRLLTKEEYQAEPDKTTTGTPDKIVLIHTYDSSGPTLSRTFKTVPVVDGEYTINLLTTYRFDGQASDSANVQMPNTATLALVYGLAVLLAHEYEADDKLPTLLPMAETFKRNLFGTNANEGTPSYMRIGIYRPSR